MTTTKSTAPAGRRPVPPRRKSGGTSTAANHQAEGKVEVETTEHSQARILDMSVFTEYVPRKVTSGMLDLDVFAMADAQNLNVLIEGPTGSGKTSGSMAYAAREKKMFYAVPSHSGAEQSQLFGKYVPDGKGGFVWVDGPVTTLVRHGGVLLINEVNFLPERIASVLFGLLDKRRLIQLLDHKGETILAHKDLLIVADCNPGYRGTRALNEAFRNRFAIKMFWDYDDSVEQHLIKSKSLIRMAKQFRAAGDQYRTPISTNMLIEFERFVALAGIDFAVINFLNTFPGDERSSAQLVVNTHQANIVSDLSPKIPSKPGDDEAADESDEGDDDFDSLFTGDQNLVWE